MNYRLRVVNKHDESICQPATVQADHVHSNGHFDMVTVRSTVPLGERDIAVAYMLVDPEGRVFRRYELMWELSVAHAQRVFVSGGM